MMQVERALDALVQGVPSLLERNGFNRDVCVLATRLACLALGEVGIKASALPTRFDGYSPAYVQGVKDGTIAEDVTTTPEDLARLREHGAWTVKIGHPENEGVARPDGRRGYNGHLVTLVERRYVLDLTIGQASRPSKGMFFMPHWFRATPEFMAGEPVVFESDGSMATYIRIDNNTYAVAPDWTLIGRSDPLVQAVAGLVRKRRAA